MNAITSTGLPNSHVFGKKYTKTKTNNGKTPGLLHEESLFKVLFSNVHGYFIGLIVYTYMLLLSKAKLTTTDITKKTN